MTDGMRVTACTWRGMAAVQIEREGICGVFLPDLGAKMVSLLDTRRDWEWLVQPDGRPLRPVPYGAAFAEQDMSGWDEMFPTISPCRQPKPGKHTNLPLPDHGEVWALPWSVRLSEEGLRFTVRGRALPYRLDKVVTAPEPATLHFRYELTNLGDEPWPYLWAAHPQFVAPSSLRIVLPDHVTEVVNVLPDSEWGKPGAVHPWPEARDVDGEHVNLDRVGPAERNRCRKFYLAPEIATDWAGLRCAATGTSLTMRWSPEHTPYLGIWIDEGAYNTVPTVALEPASAYYDDLELAWRLRRAPLISPGQRHEWHLTVELG